MNSAYITVGINARLAEAREMLRAIREREANPQDLATKDLLSATLRGMFYITLYGTLEYCVTESVQNFISFISAQKIRNAHISYVVNVVALDAQLVSARNAGEKKKWETRRAIFERIDGNSICDVDNTVFGTFLHNIWPRTLEEIFLCLGIDKPATSDPREIGYLREIVEKRNAVAHGRETAAHAGEGSTADDLQKRMDALYSVCIYFLTTLEEHASAMGFVRPRYRRVYKGKENAAG